MKYLIYSETLGYLDAITKIQDETIFEWVKWKERKRVWRLERRVAENYLSQMTKLVPDAKLIEVKK